MNLIFRTTGISLIVMALAISAFSQTTEFTYQGSMQNSSAPANGNFDFEFALFDALSGGTQLGATLTRSTVAVTAGTFAVKLDFGAQFPGANRFLEIRVRQTGGGAFTPLTPRQSVGSSPYSVQSLNASNATTAITANTATNATQLGGVAANQYVVTTDSRMTDARPPTAGSANYVQNQNAAPQSSSNFNISGTGTADIINAATQYNITGNRVLSNAGTDNLFAGVSAGQVNTTGFRNAFFGANAGSSNGTGADNAFFGANVGVLNSTGGSNVFFGSSAGVNNSTGSSNVFLGRFAGSTNTTGSNNTMIGNGANVLTGSLSFATAIGSQSTVSTSNTIALGRSAGQDTVVIPGTMNVTGLITGTATNSNQLGGVAANQYVVTTDSRMTDARPPTAGSANYVQNQNAAPQSSSNFNISGTGTADIFNAATQFNLSNLRVLSASPPQASLYVGFFAGASNTTGTGNSFFGSNAGANNTSGSKNSFFGGQSGSTNNASSNSFFGWGSGLVNSTGSFNSFFGESAGSGNTGGNDNSFFGQNAGQFNTIGANNSFFGRSAGSANTTGSFNSFFGRGAGQQNTGFRNSFFGYSAGNTNTIGNNNSFFGDSAGFSNTTGELNSFFGKSAGFGNTIGTNNSFFGLEAGSGNTDGFNNSFFGSMAGQANVSGANNAFFGKDAGRLNTSNNNSFFGGLAGDANTSGFNNAFFGNGAGGANTMGGDNVFVGGVAGTGNTLGGSNTFIGTGAGTTNTTGNNNTILGSNANVGGLGLSFATAIGSNAVVNASNTIALGRSNGSDVVVVYGLGAAGATALCRNVSNQISTCSSSLRYKSNITGFSQGMSFINKLRPIAYDWTNGGMKDVGFGAEDIAKIDPRFVTYNSSGEVEGVKYDRLSVAFVNAFKEQQTQIEELKKQNQAQQKQIEQLSRKAAEIDEIKILICRLQPGAAICVPKN